MSDSEVRPAIYFNSIELENVRCFGQRQRLDLSDESGKPVQWTLILGDNGVGKTTLLQCLAWMRPVLSPLDHSEKHEVQDGRTSEFRTEPALSIEVNTTLDSLVRIGGDVPVNINIKAELSVGEKFGSEGGESVSIQDIVTEAKMKGRNGQLEDNIPVRALPPEDENLIADLAMFAYGAARRPGTVKFDRGMRSDALVSLFRDSAELYDAEEILLKLDHRAQKPGDQQDVERLHRVKQILAIILPGIDRTENIQILGPAVFGSSSEPSGVRFQTQYALVPLSALSLGYQTTLTWIVDLALRLFEHYPESPDPLSEPGIVLIDNIDLHLHPRWQRRVMENLTACFPAVQFIATAHSPLIAQAAENASLAVLREEDGQVIIKGHPQSVNTWRADQILASDLFDIPTRSGSIQKLIRERDELLDKMNRNQVEEKRLKCLEGKLEQLPTAEASEDREAMDLIRSVAARLRDGG